MAKQRKRKSKKGFLRKFPKLCLMLLGFGLLCYAALIGWVYYQEVNVEKPMDFDSIIVLGAQVKPDGTPSVQLRWRMDAARKVYDQQPCHMVVTGGRAGTEPETEGDVMRRLFVEEGVDPSLVISESKSMDTKENLHNAMQILRELGLSRPVVVTSDYHLPRAMQIMRDMGMEPQGMGSPCKKGIFFWMKNHGREALAWVKYWAIKYLKLPL
ncbi:MAG: YdcF family protein [Clostridiales bacterium]|nr:YdcF family protein [Clostridiales bacterium]